MDFIPASDFKNRSSEITKIIIDYSGSAGNLICRNPCCVLVTLSRKADDYINNRQNAPAGGKIKPQKMTTYLFYLYYVFLNVFFLNVDGAMHFIYSHKYTTNSAEDSSDIN